MMYTVYIEGENVKYKSAGYERFSTGIERVVDDIEQLNESYDIVATCESDARDKARDLFLIDCKREGYETEISDVSVFSEE